MLITPRAYWLRCPKLADCRMTMADSRILLDNPAEMKMEGSELGGEREALVVYWASRHELSSAQREAIFELHGTCNIVREAVSFEPDADALIRYIRGKGRLAFVYVVASGHHYIRATLEGCRFGVMVNRPQKRLDGTFELQGVYHVDARTIRKVWPTAA